MTASASGSEVPSELFADIPDEVLFGSYVDGHLFRPVLEGLAPSGDGYADKVPVDDGAQPEVLAATPAKKTAARRRSTKKAETQ